MRFSFSVENPHPSDSLNNFQVAIIISPDGNPSGGMTRLLTNVVWDSGTIDTLTPGQTETGTVDYVVQADDPQFTNYRIYAWGEIEAGPDVACESSRSWDTTGSPGPFEVVGPEITVTLVDPGSGAEPGTDITWELTIENERPYVTTIQNVVDTYFMGSQPTSQCNPTGTNSIMSLLSTTTLQPAGAAGDTATASFTCTMEESYPDPTVNTVTVTAEAQTVQGEFQDSASTDKLVASITVTKSADVEEAGPGDSITYTVTVQNDGEVPLSNVTVVDTLIGLLPGFPTTFAPGQSETQDIVYIMQETDPDPLINIVTVLGASPQGNSVGANWTASVDKVNPAIRIDVTVDPAEQLPGLPVTYTFTVTNTSEIETLAGLTVTFPLCQLPGAGAGCTSDRINMSTVSLEPGEIATGTFDYTIQPSDPDPFGFTSNTTATARAVTLDGTNVSDANSVFVDILDSEIRVTKTADRDSAVRGATVTYTIEIENLSANQITVTGINDSLLGQVGNVPLVLEPTGQVGDTYTLTVQYTVSSSDPDPLVNVVDVTATSPNGDIDDSTSEVVDISDAQLFITVTSDAPVNPQTQQPEAPPGTEINFGVFVSNIGLVTLTDITGWWQVAGTGMEEQQFELDFPNDGTGLTLLPGTLAAFENASNPANAFSHTVDADIDPDPMRVQVRIEATDDQGAIRNFFGTLSIDILPAYIRVIKTANATAAAVGDTVRYDFLVENISGEAGFPETITSIVLNDDLCAEDPISETGSGSGCWGGDTQVALNGALDPIELGPGETATGYYEYIVEADDLNRSGSILENTAIVTGLLTDGETEVSDAANWQIGLLNPIEITKTADRAIAVPGDTVIYTFTVDNVGQLSTITNLVITDSRLGEIGTRASLAPDDELWIIEVPYTVQAGDAPRIRNTATVTGLINGQQISDNDDWQVEVTDPIILTKSDNYSTDFGGWPVAIGDTLTYTITVFNISSDTWTMVSAIDESNGDDPGPRVLTTQLFAGCDDGQDNQLQPGETCVVTYDYTISIDDPYYPDALQNTFTLTVDAEPQDVEYDVEHQVFVFSPYSIIKLPDTGRAVVGQIIHYDYLVTNVSEVNMDQTTVNDNMLGPIPMRRVDQGGQFTTAPLMLPAAPQIPCFEPDCTLFYLESDPDPAANTYTVLPEDAEAGRITNIVTVRGLVTTEGRFIITEEEATVPVINPLEVLKEASTDLASRGDTISYTISVTNVSEFPISNITAVDDRTGIVTLTSTTLNPGETAFGDVVVTIPMDASNPFANTVIVEGDMQTDTGVVHVINDAEEFVELEAPLLEVELTGETPYEATIGEPYTYTAILTNNSAGDNITNLTYSDSVGFTNAGGECPTELAAGDEISCNYTYTPTITDPDPLTNTLTVIGEFGGGDSVTGEDSHTIDLINPLFRVSKVAAPNVAFVGETIEYTITITNNSDGTLTEVTATDTLLGVDLPLTFPGAEGVLQDGEQATATVQYTITQADESPLVNTVSASGRRASGDILSDTTYATVLITPSPLVVDKSVSPTVVQLGDTVTYTIAVTNIGRTRVTGITLEDSYCDVAAPPLPECAVVQPLTATALDPSQVAFMSYSVLITADLVADQGDPFINTATVTGIDAGGEEVTNSDSAVVDIAIPELNFTKTADRSRATIGDTITYTVQLVNTSGSTLTGVQVRDDITDELVLMSVDGSTPSDTIANFEDGQVAIGYVTYVVTEDTPNPFVNTVTVTTDQGVTDGAADSVEIDDLYLEVIKTARTTTAAIGEEVTYDVIVRNTSSLTLTTVTALDQLSGLPITLTFPTTPGELGPDEEATGTFIYTIPPDTPDPLINRVRGLGRLPSGAFVSANDTAVVDIQTSDIALDKTADVTVAQIGDTVTYDFIVEVVGEFGLTNVQVYDPLCATATSGCTGDYVNLTFPPENDPGELGPGDSATGRMVRTVQAADADPLINTATATGQPETGPLAEDSDSVTIQIGASDLLVSKTVRGVGDCQNWTPVLAVQPGETLVYGIQVQNLSEDISLFNVEVLDTYTGDLISFATFGGTTGNLGPLGSATACITIDVPLSNPPDPFTNTVVATGEAGAQGGPIVTDTSTASIPVATGDILVTNVPDTDNATVGQVVTYTVTVRNISAEPLTNVSATSPAGPVTLGLTVLGAGQSTTGEYTHTIDPLDDDPYLSTVMAQGTTPDDTIVTDTATAVVNIGSPGLRVTKIASPTTATVGDDINYTITITNTGDEAIVGLLVTDILLGGDITDSFPEVSPTVQLAPGESVSATLIRTVTASDGDPVVNTVAVNATTVSANVLTDTASATVNITGSGITVLKEASVSSVRVGETVTYTITVINNGTTDVVIDTVNDTLNPGFVLPEDPIPPGGQLSGSYDYVVQASDPDPLVNTVTVSGTDELLNEVSDTASASVDILDAGNQFIRVTLMADRTTAAPGTTISYLATVSNIGSAQITSLTLNESTLPDAPTDLTALLSATTLDPGQSATASFTYTVQAGDTSPIVATVEAEGNVAGTGTVSDTASASVNLIASGIQVGLQVVDCPSGVDPCVAVAGDIVTYEASVTNIGGTILTDVLLNSPEDRDGGNMLEGAILSPGDTETVEFQVEVATGTPPDPYVINLHGEGTDPSDTLVSDDTQDELDTANPIIGVTVEADRTTAATGELITYAAEISNSGTEPLTNITAIDSVVGTLTLSFDTLDPGESETVNYSYSVQSDDPDPLVNTLTVSGDYDLDGDGPAEGFVTDNDSDSVNLVRPELTISTTANQTVADIGDTVIYTVVISNTGDGRINNLTGTYALYTGTIPNGGPAQRPAQQSGTIVITQPADGYLDPGENTTGTFSHTITSSDPSPLTFRVVVTGISADGETPVSISDETYVTITIGDASATNTPIPGTADPTVEKSANVTSVQPGGNVTWTVRVTNPGSSTLTSVVITDTLGSNMTLQSATTSSGTATVDGNTVSATTGSLAFNQSAVLTIIARVNESVAPDALVTNTACATRSGGTASVCDTASLRVAPDVEVLPTTGQAALAGAARAGTGLALLGLLALLLVGGAFGLDPQNPDRGLRLVLIVAAIAAALIVIVVIVALISSLTSQPAATEVAAATETPAAVVEGATQEPDTLVPPTETATQEPSGVPPTPVPALTGEPTFTPGPAPTLAPPFQPSTGRELFIPRLGLANAVPIVDLPLRNRTWDVRDLGHSIGYLEGTTWISNADNETGGNTVLAAHIQITDGVPGPFQNLNQVQIGDTVYIAEQDVIYEYRVTAVDIVAPDDVEVTFPTLQPTLTLITCTTWDRYRGVFAERLVVRALPVRVIPA